MLDCNTLTINALKGIGIESEWDPNDGQLSNAALVDLNTVIVECNLQDLLIECRKEHFVTGGSTITIGEDSSYTINSVAPTTIKSVGRKVGNRYMRLINTDKATIYGKNRMSLATLYNYTVDFDEETGKMKGEILLDTKMPNQYIVIFNKPIKLVRMSDEIPLSDTSTNLLEEGLKAKLARRFKLPDVRDFENDYTDYQELVRQNIANNRSLIQTTELDGSYLDPYYNLIGGVGF